MIKSVTVINYLGEKLILELARPEKSGFAITNIEGIGPADGTINTTEMASNDGSIFTSAKKQQRNIVLYLDFSFWPSIEDGRHETYKYFPVKKPLTLIFETDTRVSRIHGYVETNNPVIFSNTQSTQISIICPDPNFYDYNDVHTVVFSGIAPEFEFPFENDSLSESMITLSSINKKIEEVIYYEGDTSAGMTITISADGPVTSVALYNMRTNDVMRINSEKLVALTGSDIVFGDVITICTIKGNKNVTLLRDGNTTNILNCFEKDGNWFQLEKGDNIFAYSAEVGTYDLRFKISYGIIYEGV